MKVEYGHDSRPRPPDRVDRPHRNRRRLRDGPAVHRLSATLDRDDPMPKIGDPLPIGWHQLLFPRVVRHSQIGADGHPARGDFLPPVPLPRRMFAGKRVTFHAPLRIGDEVRRESTIMSVTPKQGRTGQMVFVTVKTDIFEPARSRDHRGAGHRLSRRARSERAARLRRRRAPGKAVWKQRGHARRGDAVSLFGAHLQRPSHSLRPSVRDEGREAIPTSS